ncbi:hypothetical protein HanPSC8_Chr05g0212081 [Helianthus annuus]|nr:hypothetical protein HanPSC8_Chr05g0212081 [Helianthus annuus]
MPMDASAELNNDFYHLLKTTKVEVEPLLIQEQLCHTLLKMLLTRLWML